MKIIRMKIGFWLIPEIVWTANVKQITFFIWRVIFMWKNNVK